MAAVLENDAPDLKALRALAASINASLDTYETSQNEHSRRDALANVAQTSQRLKNACTLPADAFADFTFQPMANACVRIALSMGVFDHLPGDRESGVSVAELAILTQADLDLTIRVVRGLVAFDVVNQDENSGVLWHSPMSLIYADPPRRSWAIWIWDVMVASAAKSLGPFFDGQSKPLANPSDPRNSPFTLAHNAKDSSIFDIVKSIGKLPLLNSAMSGSSVVCAKEAVASFDFGSLQPGGEDGIVLVDVGGAKGSTIQEIRRAYPELQGKVVLQDLQSVIDDGTLPDLGAEIMPYDFFKQEQPVKGASAYLYQRIFHDWSDADCQKILASLKPAMAAHSRLIICDVVVQDARPQPRKVMRDMNMLLVGGLERSQRQWNDLLDKGGFVVEKFHGLQNSDNSIIEARLK